jgi:hypothetical protein
VVWEAFRWIGRIEVAVNQGIMIPQMDNPQPVDLTEYYRQIYMRSECNRHLVGTRRLGAGVTAKDACASRRAEQSVQLYSLLPTGAAT